MMMMNFAYNEEVLCIVLEIHPHEFAEIVNVSSHHSGDSVTTQDVVEFRKLYNGAKG